MRSRKTLALAASALALTAAGCGSDKPSSGGGNSVKLNLIAYSTPQEAYEAIIPAFQKTNAGRDVTFNQSYGASGDQSRAVESGLPADVVAFSLSPDVTRLVDAGLVDKRWDKDPYHGNVTDSVVVFAVRKGNPKGIKTWDDLVKPGVEVIEPNPFTSGGARWNVMAAYGAQIAQGKTHDQGIQYLQKLFQHVPVQDKSARESLQTFANGKGDVLLAYENEAKTAQSKGQSLDYIVPDQTILIENPAAVVGKSKHPEQARAFLDFLRSPEAQRIYGQKGYRPVVKSVFDEFDFPTPKGLFKIDKFGGWSKVTKEFFDPKTGVVADIERKQGVPTDS